MNDNMRRLEEVRKKIRETESTKERLSGELSGQQKQLKELEEECRKKFGVEVSELPDLIEKLENEATMSLKEAERIMGIVNE